MEVFADDLLLDHPYPLGTYLVTKEEIVAFATQWDPLAIHVDEPVATAGTFGGLIASGLHTFGVYQRLAVTTAYVGWKIIAGRRLTNVQFPRPVRPGMTLTGSVRINGIERRDASRSLVHKLGELHDLEGNAVFSVEIYSFMENRPT